jgi:hypothetical protein
MLEEKEERRNEKKNAFFSLPFFLFRRLAAAIQQQLQQQGVIITKERERGRKQEKSDFFCSLPPRPPLHFSFPQKKNPFSTISIKKKVNKQKPSSLFELKRQSNGSLSWFSFFLLYYSPGRPGHLPASEHVEVQMVNGLRPGDAVVDHDTKPFLP